MNSLKQHLATMPIIAILRGIQPYEIAAVAHALLHAGIKVIEVPLNSPDAIESIRRLRPLCEGKALCGAGTVTTLTQVNDVTEAGAQVILTPNTNPAVIKRACELGVEIAPGCATATEALSALEAGARALKYFPAGNMGASMLRSISAVLPPEVLCLAVGNIHADNLADFWEAGVRGFGIGSHLYKPGKRDNEVLVDAKRIVAAARTLL